MAKAYIEYTEEEFHAVQIGMLGVPMEDETDARWDYPWEWA